MTIVLYTCTFVEYDQVFSPVHLTPGVEHVLFADRRPRFVRGWNWRPLPPQTRGFSQTLANRWCKFFPHRLFPAAEISIYVDGNTLILGDLRPLIDQFAASGADIGLFEHKERGNIFEEFEFAKFAGKVGSDEVGLGDAQLARYRAEGLPETHAFTENGIILRRHGSAELDAAMDLWWQQLGTYVKRDQISLPYVLHASGLKAKIWDWNYKSENPYFKRYPHRKGLKADLGTYLRNKMFYGRAYRYALSPMFALHRKIFRASAGR